MPTTLKWKFVFPENVTKASHSHHAGAKKASSKQQDLTLCSLLRASSGPPTLFMTSSFHLPAQSHLLFPIPGSKWLLPLSTMTQSPHFLYTNYFFFPSWPTSVLNMKAVFSSKMLITTYQNTGYDKHEDHNKKKSLLR
jgi:hypothetical protein